MTSNRNWGIYLYYFSAQSPCPLRHLAHCEMSLSISLQQNSWINPDSQWRTSCWTSTSVSMCFPERNSLKAQTSGSQSGQVWAVGWVLQHLPLTALQPFTGMCSTVRKTVMQHHSHPMSWVMDIYVRLLTSTSPLMTPAFRIDCRPTFHQVIKKKSYWENCHNLPCSQCCLEYFFFYARYPGCLQSSYRFSLPVCHDAFTSHLPSNSAQKLTTSITVAHQQLQTHSNVCLVQVFQLFWEPTSTCFLKSKLFAWTISCSQLG